MSNFLQIVDLILKHDSAIILLSWVVIFWLSRQNLKLNKWSKKVFDDYQKLVSEYNSFTNLLLEKLESNGLLKKNRAKKKRAKAYRRKRAAS